MTLTEIIASVTITLLPLGFLIPETSLVCGVDAGGVYFNKKIYYCDDGNGQFYLEHEKGHVLWEVLTPLQRYKYERLYEKATEFYSDYEKTNVEEDFATNTALYIMKINQKPDIQKRIRLIKSFIGKHS